MPEHYSDTCIDIGAETIEVVDSSEPNPDTLAHIARTVIFIEGYLRQLNKCKLCPFLGKNAWYMCAAELSSAVMPTPGHKMLMGACEQGIENGFGPQFHQTRPQ